MTPAARGDTVLMSSRWFQLAAWVQSLASDPQLGTWPHPVPQGHYLWPSEAWLSCFKSGGRCGRAPRALLGVGTGHLWQADLVWALTAPEGPGEWQPPGTTL